MKLIVRLDKPCSLAAVGVRFGSVLTIATSVACGLLLACGSEGGHAIPATSATFTPNSNAVAASGTSSQAPRTSVVTAAPPGSNPAPTNDTAPKMSELELAAERARMVCGQASWETNHNIVDNGDGTATECEVGPQYGLAWERSVGPSKISYADANEYCQRLALTGRAWRVPTLPEIKQLNSRTKAAPVRFERLSGTPQEPFWSSAAGRSVGTRVVYGYEMEADLNESGGARVRCASFSAPLPAMPSGTSPTVPPPPVQPGGCGDGKRDGNEQCDSLFLNGATCESLGFASGLLKCDNSRCVYDTSMCIPRSNNGGGGTSGGVGGSGR